MIKFISHNQISGTINLNNPDEVVTIEIKENSPVTYQLRFEQGKVKILRDVIHIRNNIYLCKPNIPKEFMQSSTQIKARIIIFDGKDIFETNPINVIINLKEFEFSFTKEDTYKNLSSRILELERNVKILSLHKIPPELDIPSLGMPEQGMVLTALTPNIFGWSHVFKTIVEEVNNIKAINGSITLTAKDIMLKNNNIEDSINHLINHTKKLSEGLNEIKIALIKEIEDVAELKKTLNEYVNRDIL
jgi:hypothetical protein